MKVAVSSESENITSPVSSNFGRSKYFLIVDTNTFEYEIVVNPNINALGGAGIQSAQLLISKNVQSVISGFFGNNTCRIFEDAGIKLYQTNIGTVMSVIQDLNNNKLFSLSFAKNI